MKRLYASPVSEVILLEMKDALLQASTEGFGINNDPLFSSSSNLGGSSSNDPLFSN